VATTFGAVSGASANWEAFTSWDFADTNLLSSPQGQHIGNPGASFIADWANLVQDGLGMPGSDTNAPNTGALRIGHNGNAKQSNYLGAGELFGPQFQTGTWNADLATPMSNYVYAITNNEIKLSITFSDIDWDANPNSNMQIRYVLWDKKTGFDVKEASTGNGNNPTGNYFGLQIHDFYDQDKIGVSVFGSPQILTSCRFANGANSAPQQSNQRARALWIENNNSLTCDDTHTVELRVNFETGDFQVDHGINGATPTLAASGVIKTGDQGINGIDASQTVLESMSIGDSIDIDDITISVINTDIPVLDPEEVYYQVTSEGTNVFSSLDGYIPNTNGNLIFKTGSSLGVSEVNWTNIIYEAGSAVQWSESTPTVAGTNATKITSIWAVKNQGGNAPLSNNGMTLGDGDPIWAAPGPGDFLVVENNSTKFNIDSDVTIASLFGNGRTDQGHGEGAFVSIKDGGSLTVDGVTPYANMAWVNSNIQLGTWGNSANGPYGMTLEVDGGSLTNSGVLNIAQSKAEGNLNITANGGSIDANTIQVGYDAAYRSTGTVNVAAGTLAVQSLYVGSASRGVVNVSGGQLNMKDGGQLRIGYRRTSVNGQQQGNGSLPTIDMNGDGIVDISGGTLNAMASGVTVTVGYDNSPSPETNRIAELKIRDGGIANFTAGNKLNVGGASDAILTIEDGGTLTVSDETLAFGYGPANATVNMTGGALNLTGNAIHIGGWAGGVATVNMSGGTITTDAIIMQNINAEAGTTNNGVSTVNQTGGTVTTTGAEARFGVRGDAVYNIGGGAETAKLIVNPKLESYTATSNNLGKVNLSYGAHNSTLNIESNGLVHVNSITLDSVNSTGDSATDSAVLNLYEGGTFIIEGNWAGALGAADGAEINMSGGQIIWRRSSSAAVTTMNELASAGYLNLTGGGSDVPDGGVEVFTDGDYTLYAISYNSDTITYAESNEAYTNTIYTRFVSVNESAVQSPYGQWVAGFNVEALAVSTNDYDGDGVANILEYALGGNPTNASDTGLAQAMAAMQKDGEDFDRIMLIHPRLKGQHGLEYATEHAMDIVYGTWSIEGVTEEGVDTSGSMDMVTNSIPATNSAGFLRLKIQLAE
jgi:hypothetical protein